MSVAELQKLAHLPQGAVEHSSIRAENLGAKIEPNLISGLEMARFGGLKLLDLGARNRSISGLEIA